MPTVRSRDGTSIAFEQLGDGPPLVLVDGAFCRRALGPMRPLAALLAGRFSVLAYDRRGRDQSGDTPPYTPEREVDDLAALIAAVGGTACVFGLSSGAALALAAAHALPGSISRLALYEPPFDASFPRLPDDWTTRLDKLIRDGRHGDAVALFMTDWMGLSAETVAATRREPVWPALEAIAPTLRYDIAIIGATRALLADSAAAIRLPVLVMDGADSPAWAQHAAQLIQTTIPGAQRRTLAGQTHDVAVAALAPVLLDFFSA